MSMRPLERFRSIRAKLGSVIVLAVALTLLVSYLVIGFALRNSPRDSEAIDALALARSAANGQLSSIPADVSIITRSPLGTTTIRGRELLGQPAAVRGRRSPLGCGRADHLRERSDARRRLGDRDAALAITRHARADVRDARLPPERVVAVPARRGRCRADLAVDRAMARPWDDPAAARHGGRGSQDGDGRLHVARPHAQPRRGGAARDRIQPHERRARAPRTVAARPRGERLARAEDPDHRDPRASGEPADGVEQPDRDTLQVMLGQTERLGRLVDQLLDLSKLESGEVPLELEPMALAPIIDQVISRVRRRRAPDRIDLLAEVPDDLPAVDADRERIHQVLFNLVDNAVRFTPPRRCRSRSPRSARRIGASRPSRHGRRASRPSTCRALFERFYRADPAALARRRRRHRHRPRDRPFDRRGPRRPSSGPRASPAGAARSRSTCRRAPPRCPRPNRRTAT